MKRWLSGALLAVVAFGLQGCITTALYVTNRPSQSVLNEMGRWCARDSGVRWRGGRAESLDLWIPGNLNREPDPHAPLADAEPYRDFGYGEVLLRSGIARTVLINVQERKYVDPNSGAFGPMVGEPTGIYRLELRRPNDPHCAPYLALRDKVERWNTPERRADVERQPCPSYEYVGPFDGQPRKDMYVTFFDAQADARGFTRMGAVLIVGGEVRATEVRYSAVSPNGASEHSGWWGVKACASFGTEIVSGPPQP
ncbi:MAG: hypothetical protein Q7S93_08320 [Phenylobacterium sp.]|uniref:hypothetical protein n=1 Tax=Phenylobacterium sp. TaxID=1871053 RepID=UPI00271763CF|nr:hypothetical protein [Phenylobacterium sp.]MDO8410051.1 hypothetical protein [Phenylobacterium sp.]